ncbi:hypothetical protein ACFWBG_20325 [Nocardia salmonicida]|uniref:hypothetical protein n=1 Tax=Nocardia salmonicida TaxID=53431 RepID=UPI00366CB5F1
MYYRNPTSLVFQDGDNWWIETSTGRDATIVDAATGNLIAASNAAAGLKSNEFDDITFSELVDGQILLADSNSSDSRSGYHLATRDHPFLDMSTGLDARIADAEIMAGYVESDEYPSVYLDFDSTETVVLDNAADLATDELRNSPLCQLSLIISGTFGVRRRQAPYYDPDSGYHQVELLLKSIPSGGGRHPTELFVEILRAPNIAPGQFHYRARTNSLERLSSSFFSPPPLENKGSDADWHLRLYMASAVRRAMFRYRDPRSFRAILVDAGHADGQLAALAAYCNWNYRSCATPKMDFVNRSAAADQNGLPLLMSGILEGWS